MITIRAKQLDGLRQLRGEFQPELQALCDQIKEQGIDGKEFKEAHKAAQTLGERICELEARKYGMIVWEALSTDICGRVRDMHAAARSKNWGWPEPLRPTLIGELHAILEHHPDERSLSDLSLKVISYRKLSLYEQTLATFLSEELNGQLHTVASTDDSDPLIEISCSTMAFLNTGTA